MKLGSRPGCLQMRVHVHVQVQVQVQVRVIACARAFLRAPQVISNGRQYGKAILGSWRAGGQEARRQGGKAHAVVVTLSGPTRGRAAGKDSEHYRVSGYSSAATLGTTVPGQVTCRYRSMYTPDGVLRWHRDAARRRKTQDDAGCLSDKNEFIFHPQPATPVLHHRSIPSLSNWPIWRITAGLLHSLFAIRGLMITFSMVYKCIRTQMGKMRTRTRPNHTSCALPATSGPAFTTLQTQRGIT